MNQAQALYQLQTVDLHISQQRQRLAEIEALLGDRKAITAAEQALRRIDEAMAPWHVRARDLELEIKTLTGKIVSSEQRLYSGGVTNPKELQDIQEEAASLKRWRQKLEDDLLEAMIEIEEGQANHQKSEQNLTQITAAWNTERDALLEEKHALQQMLDNLNEQRQEALKPVEPETLDIYTRLIKSKRGVVVSELMDTSCKVCGVSQTSQRVQQVRRGQGIVYCSDCGRILVLL